MKTTRAALALLATLVLSHAAPAALVGCPAIAVSPASLASGAVGAAYGPLAFTASPAASYVFTASGLPAGMSMSPGGALSGTPAQAGAFAVRTVATDANGCVATHVVPLTVAKGAQTIGFTSTTPAGATACGPTYIVSATATSGLPVAFTVDPSASAVCSISGSTVSFTGAGTCVVDANQAGDANWNPAPQAQQSFSVTVDPTPPTVAVTKVYPSGGTAGASQVTYPPVLSGPHYTTGYDGAHFLFGDAVHVQATATDTTGCGLRASAFQVRLDGVAGGGAATGVPKAPPFLVLNGCVDGSPSCSIDFDLPLDGTFEPGSGPAGNFGVTVLATDVVGNVGTSATVPVAATRFWWSLTPSSGSNVTGLAIHPNGTVIATTTGALGTDSIFGVERNGPFAAGAGSGCAAAPSPGQSWCFGASLPLGAASGAAMIGFDLVYVSSASGKTVAVSGTGALQWTCAPGAPTAVATGTPAFVRIPPGNTEAALFSDTTGAIDVVTGSAPACSSALSQQLSTGDSFSGSPIVANGTFYAGTSSRVLQTSLDATGAFTTPAYFGSSLGKIDGLAFDGGSFYAASNAQSSVYQFGANLTAGFKADFVTASPQGLPVALPGQVLSSDSAGALRTMPGAWSPGIIAASTLLTLQNPSRPTYTPLLGSDGRAYVGGNGASMFAVKIATPSLSWTYVAPSGANFTVPPTMDCFGHLYAAAGDTVYAFRTDARGLMNTPWPKYQRDTRNSGNADRVASNGAPYGVFNGTSCEQ